MENIIELFENAKKKGLGVVVFMDEGTIQAFPKIERLAKKYASDNFKVIYGMNAYIVDDEEGIACDSPITRTSLIVKNQEGMNNLFRLVTDSYLKYYNGVPRIPKSVLQKISDGILSGPDCREIELFRNAIEDVYVLPKESKRINIPGAYESIEKAVYNKFFKMYGNSLPKPVADRLSKELTWIKKNRNESVFYLAKLLADNIAEQEGECRCCGSMGASLVAYALGITQVNPLPAHYYCPICHSIEWQSDINMIGLKLQDKQCTVCGADMMRDGFNIPPESCFGCHGEKRIYIDLMVPDNWKTDLKWLLLQVKGIGDIIPAGRITKKGMVTDKVKYMLIPKGVALGEFLPLQMADNEDTVVTHFEYTDIFGIFDEVNIVRSSKCTMLNELAGVIGVELNKINIYDKKIIASFTERGLSDDDIVKMSGLQSLIGKSIGVEDAVANKDDIMLYLVSKGMEREVAYDIMECVRKGVKLHSEYVDAMKAAGVSEAYINSCENVEYLYSRAYLAEILIRELKIEYLINLRGDNLWK